MGEGELIGHEGGRVPPAFTRQGSCYPVPHPIGW
jgi:hypothetical protein